jgi:hypothetical protein
MAEETHNTQFICTIVSENNKITASFPNLDDAFKYILEEFIKEGGFSLSEASVIMNDVKNLYIETGKQAEFNVWEVEDNSGKLVQMFIKQS